MLEIKFNNKKGVSPIGLLGEIVIVLAVIIILLAIVIVPKLFQQSEIAGVQISGIQGDADKDGVRNFFDQCPCTFGEIIADGCPITFTAEQRQEDVKKYHSEPACGIVAEAAISQPGASPLTPQNPVEEPVELPGEKKPEPAAFKLYQSVEIFGDTDDEDDSPQNDDLRLACTGWVGGSAGTDCHSEDDDCDGEFNLKPLKDGCWIMASEDDNEGNDCGQAKVDDETIIPLDEYRNLNVDVTNNYESIPAEADPKNLFTWSWSSRSEYGSLLCKEGFWHGCLEKNEGRTLSIGDKTYECSGSEWVEQ